MPLDIENEGEGLMEFEITRVLDQSIIKNPAWLTIEPTRGVVKPGEKKTISFTGTISQREAQVLFLYKDFEESVMISTNESEAGRIHKVKIKCEYLRSCFGAALPILNQCTGVNFPNIREELQNLPSDMIIDLLETRKLNNFTLPIPKELYKLVNYILEHGKLKPNIFFNSGNAII